MPLQRVVNWNYAPDWMEGSKEYFAKTKPSKQASALVHLLPFDLLNTLYKSPDISVAFTTFETTMLPHWLVESINSEYKGMIVPSEFNVTCLKNSGIKIPVKAVNHPISTRWLTDINPPPEKDKNRYVFGYVGFWNNRKNPKGVLDAYLKAFPKDNGETALLLKTYRAEFNVDEYAESICGEKRDDIWVYNESWTEQQMLWAFAMMDCYVSAHRGEGFGLGLAQAAALGKPVIYTNFSAPNEWLTQGHYPLDFDMTQVKEGDFPGIYRHMQGEFYWSDVSQDHLVETLRSVATERPKEGFNKENLQKFREFMSWESVGKKLVDAMESILEFKLERLDLD